MSSWCLENLWFYGRSHHGKWHASKPVLNFGDFLEIITQKQQNYEVSVVKTRFFSSFSSQSNIGVWLWNDRQFTKNYGIELPPILCKLWKKSPVEGSWYRPLFCRGVIHWTGWTGWTCWKCLKWPKSIEILRIFWEFQLFEPVVGHLTGWVFSRITRLLFWL